MEEKGRDNPSLFGMMPDEITSAFRSLGQPAFRARQVWDWLYRKQVCSFDQMRNLPAGLRAELDGLFSLFVPEQCQCAGAEGETQKLLLCMDDGATVETVIIPAPRRGTHTVCLSCQIGCRYGCAFCASGQGGVVRDLAAGEIIGQLLVAAARIGRRPDNVVFMGMGEPFDNYEAVLRAVRIMNHPDGLGIGARRITLSTCGVIPGIERLAAEGLQVELSVSLHAPDPETRARLMPVEAVWPLEDLLDACRAYTHRTGRIITFEYTLVQGVNDREEQARELVRRIGGFPCRVNLIPLSPVEEFDGTRPSRETVQIFQRVLEQARINTTLRDSKGASLKAACGQLRHRRIAGNKYSVHRDKDEI